MPLLSRCITLNPGIYRFVYNYIAGISLPGQIITSGFYVAYGKSGTDPKTWQPVKEYHDIYTPYSGGIVEDEIAVEITETDEYVFAFFLDEELFNLMLYGVSLSKSAPDMAFSKVFTPAPSCLMDEETLGAEVYNRSSVAASEFTLTYKISGSNTVTEIFTQTVEPKDTVTVYFAQPANFSAIRDYVIDFTVSAPDEEITDNNTAKSTVKHTEAITELPFESVFDNETDIAEWFQGEGNPGLYGGWHVTEGTTCYFGVALEAPLLSLCITLQPGQYRFSYKYATGIELFGTIYRSDFHVAYGKPGTDPKTWAPAKAYTEEYVPSSAPVEDGFDVTITEAGEYVFAFFVTSASGDLSLFQTSLSKTVGVEENLLNETQLSLYPNPAEDVLNIELQKNTINSITIYNALGKAVYTASNLSTAQFNVNTGTFDSGLYFITVQTPHGTVNTKFVVK